MKEKVKWDSKNKKDIEAKNAYVVYKMAKKIYQLRFKGKNKNNKHYKFLKYWRRMANSKLSRR